MAKYAITYDIGTTGVKTCIFELGDTIKLVSAASEGYKLYVFPDGGAEQEPQEWWDAMCVTTKKVLDKCDVDIKDMSNERNFSRIGITALSITAALRIGAAGGAAIIAILATAVVFKKED